MKKLLVFLLILFSMLLLFYVNKGLQRLIAPRKSFVRLLIYILICFALVFLYTFLFVVCISKMFPLPKR